MLPLYNSHFNTDLFTLIWQWVGAIRNLNYLRIYFFFIQVSFWNNCFHETRVVEYLKLIKLEYFWVRCLLLLRVYSFLINFPPISNDHSWFSRLINFATFKIKNALMVFLFLLLWQLF